MADFPLIVQPSSSENSHCSSMKDYMEKYEQSIADPKKFWLEISKQFYWKKSDTSDDKVSFNFNPQEGPVSLSWFSGWQTNICYNVLDRIVDKGHGETIAFYWEGNELDDCSSISYRSLLEKVKHFSNSLKHLGVVKGDRVALCMPMVVELAIAMLACARIGAMHSIVFAGFSSESFAGRILDSKAKLVITADGFYRGEKFICLKGITDEAIVLCEKEGHSVEKCVVLRHVTKSSEPEVELDLKLPPLKRHRGDVDIHWNPQRDVWWHQALKTVDSNKDCEPEWMDAEDPLFMLYTSGSTGKPKGIVHTVGGYMIYAATTFKYSINYNPGDIYFCTADIGWITGHSYVTYGPMANAATGVIFEGTPLYPDAGRLWAIVEKYKVNQLYTAPTAIRMLMKFGSKMVKKHDCSSLRVLGTVGEPINPDSWRWYYEVVGDSKCAVVDTYWQTETGGHVITNLPFATPMKPGAASFPFFGIEPAILNDDGKVIEGEGEGFLVIQKPWPGMARTVYGDHARYESTYFGRFPGFYMTGDRAKRDADGYYWIMGRVDDMINVSGHLLSTAEVEGALVEHPKLVEAAVVPKPHKIKGDCVYCFVTLKNGREYDTTLQSELTALVRKKMGGYASPDYIQNAPQLPKTRSGKIMRRILRKIAARAEDEIGDVSTLADPSVVTELIALRPDEKDE